MQIATVEFPLADGDALIVSADGVYLKSGSLSLDPEMLARVLRAYSRKAPGRWFPRTQDDGDRWRLFKEAINAD